MASVGKRNRESEKFESRMTREREAIVAPRERTIADIERDIERVSREYDAVGQRVNALSRERSELAQRLREENLAKGIEAEKVRAEAFRASKRVK